MVSTKIKMGRRADNADPLAIPPALPPSVEEAYRRKCLQLKQRTMEVEEANDAARLRLTRLQRQVEKLRIERAFLLEQIAKRTSTNVEDSEGSPSPPPTPQEKPLRSKRGHRKPSVIANLESNGPPPTFINQSMHTLSPSSDAFSHSHAEVSQKDASHRANGVSKPPKKPSSAFELYCDDHRSAVSSKGEGVNVEAELTRGWEDLPEGQREEYKTQETKAQAQYEKEKDAYAEKDKTEAKPEQPAESQAEDTPARDEDVDMQTDDTPAADD
ncbi:High mobility group protein B3 [Cytospora mali]|uniref:High mobility group protein B3 n=1 Tax=Cytospora mali TaxID=578113 RepID=A0A194V7I5_CYTMA|nr:High mobility group protein B3 [Valsa mali var. pyri (nom. inval.)]